MLTLRSALISATLVLASRWILAQETPRVATGIPSDVATVESLKAFETKGSGPRKLRPTLGIRFGAFRRGAAEIQTVDPGSSAANEGLLPGDQVRSIGRIPLADADDLERAVAALRVGEAVQLAVRRPGIRRDTLVELGPGDKDGDPGFEYRHTQGQFVVTSVRPGSPAATGGIKVGDTFTQIDRVYLSSTPAAKKLIQQKRKFTVHVQRQESLLQPVLKPTG